MSHVNRTANADIGIDRDVKSQRGLGMTPEYILPSFVEVGHCHPCNACTGGLHGHP